METLRLNSVLATIFCWLAPNLTEMMVHAHELLGLLLDVASFVSVVLIIALNARKYFTSYVAKTEPNPD